MQNILSVPVMIVLLTILTLVSFIFSASETSIIGLSKIRLRHMLSRGIKRAQSIQRIISKLDKFITAILVGNNFANIAISAIVTGICVYLFGYKWGIIISALATASFIVILCEITPKILAIKHTERVALLVSPIMEVFIKVFTPFIAVFSIASEAIIKILGIKSAKRSPLVTEEELRMMVELGKEEGFLSDEEGKMLQRIFEFGDIKVKDVMIPKDKMVAVNTKSGPEEILNIFVEEGHARLPVYDETLTNITGIIYARDLLYVLRDKGLFILQDLVHPAYTVGANAAVSELLMKFQSEKIQIAIVVDDRKRAIGLVTLEDLIEEIVGELEEKHTGRRHSAH